MGAMFQSTRHSGASDIPLRGYHAVYRLNEVNHCPGCGRTHRLVGRTMAECGFCATALPLTSGDVALAWITPIQ